MSCSQAIWRSLAIVAVLTLLPADLRAQKPAPSAPPAAESPVPDLAAFLSAHPTVASAMICEFPSVTLSYKDWTPAEKEYLRNTFARAMRGEPSGLPEPLPNAFPLRDDENVRQGLGEQDALQLYFANVAWSLAFEMRRTVPWSILEYTSDELAVLFDSRQMFQLVPRPKGATGPAIYEIKGTICGNSLPAAPDVSLAFIERHKFFGTNALGTVNRLLGWCEGLTHFTGLLQAGNVRAQWHYEGYPPASRIIAGTVFDDGKGKPSATVSHYTAGCHGTTGFLRSVLRCVNIPVENIRVANHSLPYFPTIDRCMTHGDDPYNLLVRTTQPHVLGGEIVIDSARFEQLFGKSVAAPLLKMNVGLRTRELAVDRLPLQLLVHYLNDQKAGKNHADGEVVQALEGIGTVQQLEARGLWAKMDARITELGGLDKVRALDAQLIASTTNHTPE